MLKYLTLFFALTVTKKLEKKFTLVEISFPLTLNERVAF